MSIRAILFDLDGTLLPMDTDHFIHTYLKKISNYVGHLVDPEVFLKQLWSSTYAMIKSQDANLTNQQVFEQDFYAKLGLSIEEVEPILNQFYEEEFPKLVDFASSHGFIPELIALVKERRYKMVVATNPLFPRSAIYERIRWTGVKPEDFAWVTVYEESHFCKPNPRYFREIAEKIGIQPEECLMVGNDVQEDLVAQKAGMKTYLVTDHKIDRGEPVFTPDGQGTMRDFYEELTEKKGIFA